MEVNWRQSLVLCGTEVYKEQQGFANNQRDVEALNRLCKVLHNPTYIVRKEGPKASFKELNNSAYPRTACEFGRVSVQLWEHKDCW